MGFVKTRAHLLGLGALMALYLAGTLYPFQWIVNDASLEQGVAVFEQRGILSSRTPPSWLDEVIAANALAVELEVKPFVSHQAGPARILTISLDHDTRNLTIGQEARDLIVRLRRSAQTPNGTPPYVVADVFREGAAAAIVVSIEGDGLSVWVDGEPSVEATLPADALSHWDSEFLLALGNELTWERPWRGEIARASIRTPTKSVDLLSSSAVQAPGLAALLERRFMLFSTNPFDLLVNLLGFIPIGALSLMCLSRPSPVLAVLIWLPACLTAELSQLFLVHRYSSLSDLVLNLLGCAIGAHLLTLLRQRAG